MNHKEIIAQLESLKKNSQSFIEKDEPNSIWQADIVALDAAIEIVRNHPKLVGRIKKLKHSLQTKQDKRIRRYSYSDYSQANIGGRTA